MSEVLKKYRLLSMLRSRVYVSSQELELRVVDAVREVLGEDPSVRGYYSIEGSLVKLELETKSYIIGILYQTGLNKLVVEWITLVKKPISSSEKETCFYPPHI